MTPDLEGDLRDALLPLRDWETATGGAPDDLVAAILDVFAPLVAERDEAERMRVAHLEEVNALHEFLGELLGLLPGATETGMDAMDQIPRAIKALAAERDRLTELNEAATRLHAHALGTNDELSAQLEAESAAQGLLRDERDAIARERDDLAEEARHQRETAEAALKGWKAVMAERDEARTALRATTTNRDDLARTVRDLRPLAKQFEAIADIYDRFVDGDLTPYDAIQAVGEQVGDR